MDNDQAPALDVKLIVADLNGPGAVGVTTLEGQRFLVVDKTFPRNDPRARARFFRAYQMQAMPDATA